MNDIRLIENPHIPHSGIFALFISSRKTISIGAYRENMQIPCDYYCQAKRLGESVDFT
jgi:hypothetical protein